MEHPLTTLNEFAIQFPIFFMIPQGYLPCAKLNVSLFWFFNDDLLCAYLCAVASLTQFSTQELFCISNKHNG